MKRPIFRLFSENRRYAPGLVLTVLLLLSTGFFRTGSAYLFGSMTDAGLSGDFASLGPCCCSCSAMPYAACS
ncbi:MAG TPA: hypothetical protein PKE04_12120 [Clostridia bacterium]|nr:hypothetical protein [Clostridia bacterium]